MQRVQGACGSGGPAPYSAAWLQHHLLFALGACVLWASESREPLYGSARRHGEFVRERPRIVGGRNPAAAGWLCCLIVFVAASCITCRMHAVACAASHRPHRLSPCLSRVTCVVPPCAGTLVVHLQAPAMQFWPRLNPPADGLCQPPQRWQPQTNGVVPCAPLWLRPRCESNSCQHTRHSVHTLVHGAPVTAWRHERAGRACVVLQHAIAPFTNNASRTFVAPSITQHMRHARGSALYALPDGPECR